MFLRPSRSEVEDQTMRPAELHNDRIATKPAAVAASAFASDSGKKSLNIGAAFSRMPMPAVTLKQRTTQSNQNCGVLIALDADTWLSLMPSLLGPGTQPAGRQPGAGTRIRFQLSDMKTA